MSNKFELSPEQKKLCHELTMEALRQNDALKLVKNKNGKGYDRGYPQIRKAYFAVYEELAIGVYEEWKRLEELYLG